MTTFRGTVTLARFLAAVPALFVGDICHEVGLAIAGSTARRSA